MLKGSLESTCQNKRLRPVHPYDKITHSNMHITTSLLGDQTDNSSNVVLGTLNFSPKNCKALHNKA